MVLLKVTPEMYAAWPDFNCNGRVPNFFLLKLMPRVSILSLKGEVLARMGGEKSFAPGQFVAPHCLWKDSRGCLYVGEVLEGQRIQKFIPAQS